jgi:hypothetical protein
LWADLDFGEHVALLLYNGVESSAKDLMEQALGFGVSLSPKLQKV